MSTETQPRARIFKEPITTTVRLEFSDRVTGEYTGVAVGVALDNQVVWQRNIYPILMLLRITLLLNVPNPLFSHSIEVAERKARKIASRLQ